MTVVIRPDVKVIRRRYLVEVEVLHDGAGSCFNRTFIKGAWPVKIRDEIELERI